MKEESYINELSTNESEMLHEAIKLSVPKLGLDEKISRSDNNISAVEMLNILSKELFGEPYSYNLFVDIMLKGYKKPSTSSIESNEDIIIKEIIAVFVKSLDETQREKFAREYKFTTNNNVKVLTENIINRYNLSDSFKSLMPLLITATTLKSAKYLYKASTVSMLAPLLMGVFAMPLMLTPIIGIKTSILSLFGFITTKAGKKINPTDLNVIFLVLYIIRRNHKVDFSNAKECIKYLSAVIKEDTHEEEATVAILSSIILFNDTSEIACKIKSHFLPNLNFNENKILPTHICKIINKMNVVEKDLVINYLMERLFHLDEKEIENWKHSNKNFHNEKIGYLYYKFPYTRVDDMSFYIPIERNIDKEHLTYSEYLYVYYKGLDPFEHIRFPKKGEIYKISYTIEQQEDLDKLFESAEEPICAFIFNKHVNKKELQQNISEMCDFTLEEWEEFIELIEKCSPERKLYELIYNLILENRNLNSRLECISQVVHREKHAVSPEIGVIKSLAVENKDKIVEKLNKIVKRFEDIVSCVDKPDNLEYKDITSIIKKKIEEVYDDCELRLTSSINIPLYVCIDNQFVPTVIDNIINNARKHGFIEKNKKYIIDFSLEQVGNVIKLIISNNGNPFNGDESKIFEYEYKFGPFGNTGEGLSLVKRYMNNIGGDVRFISSPNSEFPVSFELIFKKQKK